MSSIAGALRALVPGLDAVLGAAPEVADLDAADARHWLQRAATRLVAITASYRPVVLAIDDLRALTSIEITANVAEFLGRAIDQLRPADSAVLSALACIGCEFDLAAAAAQRPIREGLPQLRDAIQEALDRGDHEYAGFLAAILLYQSLGVCRPLAELDAFAQSVIPEIRSQRVPSSLCRSVQQYCLNLMGRCDDPFLLVGESGYDEREGLPVARREHDGGYRVERRMMVLISDIRATRRCSRA